MAIHTSARGAALLLALGMTALAAPSTAKLNAKALSFAGHPCKTVVRTPTYAPQWPHTEQDFVATSRLMGLNMEAAMSKAVKKSGRPMKLRWAQDPNTYVQYLSYAPYRGQPAAGMVIVAQFEQGKTYVSSCEVKLK